MCNQVTRTEMQHMNKILHLTFLLGTIGGKLDDSSRGQEYGEL